MAERAVPVPVPVPDRVPVLSVQVSELRFGETAVLADVLFEVRRGETLALTGPSGVGKTSLLRIIAGLETRFQGAISAPAKTAMIFQEPTLLPWRNLRDNISITTGASVTVADQALAEVGLAGREDDFPGQLSLGQQRRLSLARGLAMAPDLLLMDEPFVSLDPALADEMMTLFEQLTHRRDMATILVTHVEAEAKRLASRIVTLDGSPGRITRDTG